MVEKVVTVIPATADAIAPEERPITKVAAYARVSTLNPEQEESYESQKKFYQDLINETEGWELTEIYADQASGLNTKKRTDFKRMLSDAKKGRFQLLLVKSISRFGRNQVDTISSIRELQSYGTEVRFQKESLSTNSPQINFLLAIMASMAEQESISISQNFSGRSGKAHGRDEAGHPSHGGDHLRGHDGRAGERQELCLSGLWHSARREDQAAREAESEYRRDGDARRNEKGVVPVRW